MEQSVLVSENLTFHSPALDEVRRRLNDRTVSVHLGSLVEAAGGGPEPLGRGRGRRVRLERPRATNHAVPVLVGTLDAAEDGGTILTAQVSYSFGWPHLRSHHVEDFQYVIQALARIGQLAQIEDE